MKEYNNEILTPIQEIFPNVYAKREDYASYINDDISSGVKVRAYDKMINEQSKDSTLLVGCSADSMMQVYVTEMANKYGMKSKIFIPKRAKRSDLTKQCIDMGGNIHEIPYPCYPSHYRKYAKEYANTNKCIKWIPNISINDTIYQTKNIPKNIKRIIVPCGSGAVAVGIISGLILNNISDIEVVLVKVSTAFGGIDEINQKVCVYLENNNVSKYVLPNITIIPPSTKYGKKVYANLPDGTELDYSYSAKAYNWLLSNKKDNDLLWISGRRKGLKLNYKNIKYINNVI